MGSLAPDSPTFVPSERLLGEMQGRMEGLERTIGSLETMTRDIWQSLTDLRAENRRDHEAVVKAISDLQHTAVSKDALDRVEESERERGRSMNHRVDLLEAFVDKSYGISTGLRVLLWVSASVVAVAGGIFGIVSLLTAVGSSPF